MEAAEGSWRRAERRTPWEPEVLPAAQSRLPLTPPHPTPLQQLQGLWGSRHPRPHPLLAKHTSWLPAAGRSEPANGFGGCLFKMRNKKSKTCPVMGLVPSVDWVRSRHLPGECVHFLAGRRVELDSPL